MEDSIVSISNNDKRKHAYDIIFPKVAFCLIRTLPIRDWFYLTEHEQNLKHFTTNTEIRVWNP